MELLVIRHGIAEDRESAARQGIAESERALTDKGIRRMRAVAEGLRTVVPELTVIGHSPLRRAQETAEIVAACYPKARWMTVEALMPGSKPSALESWLAEVGSDPIAVVGHEPDLGRWIARLLTGQAGDFAPLKKGGICCLRFDSEPHPAGAVLQWMLPPRLLRTLA